MSIDAYELITAAEAAQIAGITPSTFRAYVARGQAGIPAGVEIGDRRFYMRAEIEAWAASRPAGALATEAGA